MLAKIRIMHNIPGFLLSKYIVPTHWIFYPSLSSPPHPGNLGSLRSVAYPSYYVQPFHGYDEGNLSWRAAHKLEAATQSMCLGSLADFYLLVMS